MDVLPLGDDLLYDRHTSMRLSDKLWTCCWDSEPQLPHLATSCGWGKRGERVWQLAGPQGALRKHWCPPLALSSTQLLNPALDSDGSHYLDG